MNANFEKAVALARAGRVAEAVPLFARAVKAHPKDAVLRFNLANALRMTGQGKSAAQEYEACLKLDGGLLDARMNLALLYNELGRPEKAVEQARAVLDRIPLHAGAILALCVAARQSQRIEELTPFLQSIIDPLLAAPVPPAGPERDRHHYAVAGVCELLKRPEDAAPHFLAAKALPLSFSMGLRHKSALCDWSDFDRLRQELEAQATAAPDHVAPLAFLPLSDDPALQRRVATAATARFRHIQPLPKRRNEPGRHLRIGYMSADFREHPVGYLAADTIARHDRERFEVFLYSSGPDDGSEWAQRYRKMGRFVDLLPLSDLEAAQTIERDRIDVLVDLGGHTAMSRLPVLAYRPAKVRMSWLGYPGTTGWEAVDYLIADHHTVPAGDEGHCAEAIIRLPLSLMPSSRDRLPAEDETVDRPSGGFILSAFNQPFKITPALFDVWCGLLRHRDDAILWLPAPVEQAKANLRREAAARSVDPDRLVFAERVPSLSRHLARYRHADLQLDSFPYGGHTTTNDALLMGCPVLALTGNAFPSRLAAGLLYAAELGDLVCRSLGEYGSKAMDLMDNPALLTDMRTRIRQRGHVLFQPERFCRELEYAYETAVARFESGQQTQAFDVPLLG